MRAISGWGQILFGLIFGGFAAFWLVMAVTTSGGNAPWVVYAAGGSFLLIGLTTVVQGILVLLWGDDLSALVNQWRATMLTFLLAAVFSFFAISLWTGRITGDPPLPRFFKALFGLGALVLDGLFLYQFARFLREVQRRIR